MEPTIVLDVFQTNLESNVLGVQETLVLSHLFKPLLMEPVLLLASVVEPLSTLVLHHLHHPHHHLANKTFLPFLESTVLVVSLIPLEFNVLGVLAPTFPNLIRSPSRLDPV